MSLKSFSHSRNFWSLVFRIEQKLHERPMAFHRKSVAVERAAAMEIPPGRSVMVVTA